MTEFTFWLGSSATVIVALVLVYFSIKLAMKLAQAGIGGAIEGIVAFCIVVAFLAFIGWSIINNLYINMKEGAKTSPMTSDIVSILGQAPANFGLTEPKKEAAAQAQPVAESAAVVVATQVPQQPPASVSVAKPSRIIFAAVSASGFADGTQDICGYDWTQEALEWAVTQTIMCNDADLPGETVSVDPRTLTGISVALPAIPGNVVAVIVPTPAPTLIPPVAVATPQDPAQLMLECSQLWASWASRIDLHSSREQYGTDMVPMGVTFTIKGGQTIWRESSEDWFLSIPPFGVADFQINGVLGRSLTNLPAKHSVREYVGTGPQCSSLFVP